LRLQFSDCIDRNIVFDDFPFTLNQTSQISSLGINPAYVNIINI